MELFFLLQCLSLLSFFLIYLYFHYTQNFSSSTIKVYPILGNLPDFIKNRHRFLDWTTGILANTPTNTFTFRRPGKVQGILTANPQNVEHMLKTNFQNYPKGERFIFLLQDFLGQGIFNSDAHLWLIQRKTASFEFNTKSLRNFVIQNVKIELQTRLIPLLQKAAETNQVVDIQDVLERFAFDNICILAFNEDPACLSGDGMAGRDFMRAFEDAATLSAGRFMYVVPFLYKIKKLFNLGSEKRLLESIRTVHDFADKIIQSRMSEEGDKQDEETDLLSRFIKHEKSDSEMDSKSAKFLRDVVISFILAGRDTTSSALSWFIWLLSNHPHVEEKILDEIRRLRKRNGTVLGDIFKFEELREMYYLHAVISEAMRLFPPVAVDTKACLEDDVMPDGTFIAKGWFATYHTYAMGRMESIWGKDCLEFVPERWLENGVFRVENPFRYPVFHAGPRMCLGKDMAYIQMKSIAASLIERFEMDVIGKEKCPEHVLSLTLRMKHGLMVRLKVRDVDVVG